uniref:Peptidase A1 domain-containing protein n=1 Tax=Nicotiana tabacum TaxID=4097 RepID=A0A1S4ATV4_TOBAC|nr:PREDICTED: uncharacterized protein LOC107801245 [Nicotiana tabacum]
MARALLTHNLPILISFICLLFIHHVVVSNGISDVSNESFVFLPSPNSTNDGDRSTMFLPLFPPKEISRPRDEQLSRRHLQKSPSSARMPLHDDLLLNGYYTTRLWIGTPPQSFALIVDTGSTVTYVPCSTCEQCGNHQVPSFLSYILSFNHLVTIFILLPQKYSINLKYPMLGYESGEASIGHKTSAEFKLNILLTLVFVTII